MPPRLRGRASLAAVALSALLLTGCTPSEPAEAGIPSTGDGGAPSAQPVVAQPSSTLEAGDPATVVRVIDGDTIVVRRDGQEETVRLLNIDTPETKHPNKAVQCLGPEATQALETLLRPGDDVVLRYDLERTDKYGRTLAGVFEDEVLVNAEIARLGLGVPVVFDPNRRFYPEVLAAWNEAEGEQADQVREWEFRGIVDAVVLSGEVGARKPERAAFQAAADALGDASAEVGNAEVAALLEAAGVTAWVGQMLIKWAGTESRSRLLVFTILIGSQLLKLVVISFGGEHYIQQFLRSFDNEYTVFLIVMLVLTWGGNRFAWASPAIIAMSAPQPSDWKNRPPTKPRMLAMRILFSQR